MNPNTDRPTHSNTGHLGITATFSQRKNRRVPCLTVSVRPSPNKVINRKFYYREGSKASFVEALDAAKRWRAEHLRS